MAAATGPFDHTLGPPFLAPLPGRRRHAGRLPQRGRNDLTDERHPLRRHQCDRSRTPSRVRQPRHPRPAPRVPRGQQPAVRRVGEPLDAHGRRRHRRHSTSSCRTTPARPNPTRAAARTPPRSGRVLPPATTPRPSGAPARSPTPSRTISNGIGHGEPAAARRLRPLLARLRRRRQRPPVRPAHLPPAADGVELPHAPDARRRCALPILGLPDCSDDVGDILEPVTGALDGTPLDPGVTYDTLIAAGIPIPANLGFPSYIGLEEALQVHLQAIRLGDVLLTVCPCEQWADQSRNIKSRADRAAGQPVPRVGLDRVLHAGADDGDDWRCPNPGAVGGWNGNPASPPRTTTAPSPSPTSSTDASAPRSSTTPPGGTTPASLLDAESEPADPADIQGSHPHRAVGRPRLRPRRARSGWPTTTSATSPPTAEYMRGDHYRKALTGLGPHSSDWFATRPSVAMGGALRRRPAALCGARSILRRSTSPTPPTASCRRPRRSCWGWRRRSLPVCTRRPCRPTPGRPAALVQPSSIARFDVAQFTWRGGNNYTDDPLRAGRAARRRRAVETAGDMSGEVVVTLDYADGRSSASCRTAPARTTVAVDGPLRGVRQRHRHGPGQPDADRGTYRFVVDGRSRTPDPRACRCWP